MQTTWASLRKTQHSADWESKLLLETEKPRKAPIPYLFSHANNIVNVLHYFLFSVFVGEKKRVSSGFEMNPAAPIG